MGFIDNFLKGRAIADQEHQQSKDQEYEGQKRKLEIDILNHQVKERKIADALQKFNALNNQPARETQVGQPGTHMPDVQDVPPNGVAPLPSPNPSGFIREDPLPPVAVPFDDGSVTLQPQSLQDNLRKQFAAKVADKQLDAAFAPPIVQPENTDLVDRHGNLLRPGTQKKPTEAEIQRGLASGFYRDIHKLDPAVHLTDSQVAQAEVEYAAFKEQKQQAARLLTPEQEAQQVRIATEKAAAAATEKAPTQNESNAFSFFQRLTNAEAVIAGLEPAIKSSSKIRLNYAPNWLQSDEGQRFNQASGDFINAALRRESGAAISQSEYQRFNKLYFPQPGDTDATLKQKATARSILISGMKGQAGRAYKQSFGDEPAAGKGKDRLGILP